MIALVLNAGSSSLKVALFELTSGGERELFRGQQHVSADTSSPDVGGGAGHAAALRAALAELETARLPTPTCAGHRLVHGGPRHAPARVDAALLASLRELVPLSPLHLPAELDAVDAVARALPDAPQVVCFDTAFHATMPEVATHLPLPQELFARGVRRYGFHGLSYEHVVNVLGPALQSRAVIAHLGSGSSMVAVRDGRSIDTTMGMTPTGGMVMGTRSGDLDPGALVHLLDHGYDVRSLERLVERESGLRALSGGVADVKVLLERREGAGQHGPGDPRDEEQARAAFALRMFVYSATKSVGALAAALGGLDTLVFTGGIGEHAAAIPKEICAGLEHLGVRLDVAANARAEPIVSGAASPCTVRVVPADEERMIAIHVRRLLR